MRHFFIVTLFSLSFIVSLSGQDQHFSQFYVTPIAVNPAFTGAINGTYRLAGIYRNQWFSNLKSPDNSFNTFAGSYDMRFKFDKSKIFQKDAVGGGVFFQHSNAGISEFQNNTFVLSAAFHKALDNRKKQFFSLGVQLGVIQRSLNFNQLNFEDEFNGIDGFDIDSNEELPNNSTTVEDINVGLLYTFAPTKSTSYFIGGNINHITSPILNLYEVGGEDVFLERKYGLQLGGEFPFLFEKMVALPRLLVNAQGPHFESNVGSNFRIQLKGYDANKIYFGGWARVVGDVVNAYTLDALTVMGGYQIGGLKFGASYDLAIIDVFRDPIFKERSAFEISISFLGNLEGDGVVCPDF